MGIVWWSIAAVVLALIALGVLSDALTRRRRRRLGLAASSDDPKPHRSSPGGGPGGEVGSPFGHGEQALDATPALRDEAHRPRPFPWSTGSP